MQGPQIITAWRHWLESPEGKDAANPFSLPPGAEARELLKNRLRNAFDAGVRAAEKHHETGKRIVDPDSLNADRRKARR